MPQRPQISRLPVPIRVELNRRLVDSNFGELVATSAWLKSKGYPIGKTAIGIYALSYKAKVAAEVEADRRVARVNGGSRVEIRMRCLQVAAANGPARTVVDRAATYAEWVLNADA